MDMSLDDIIKTKKISAAPSKKFGGNQVRPSALPLKKIQHKPAFKDARLKIIQKNRAKIRDARDKLVEITRTNGDVRKKLLEKQEYSAPAKRIYKSSGFENSRLGKRSAHSERGLSRTVSNVNKILISGSGLKTRNHSGNNLYKTSRRNDDFTIPRGYVDYDNMEKMEEEEYAAASRLSRTVNNDMAYGMSAPLSRHMDTWGGSYDNNDPFDVYEVPVTPSSTRSKNLPPPPAKGILRSTSIRDISPDPYQRRYIPDETTHLSYEMRSRLERAPDPHASEGIFSNPIRSSGQQIVSSQGYRIVVSNLHASVTKSDIQELFEDIGELYESRIVRPGVAEVIYKSLNDAEKAVDTYHNRQLDGQPMKCLLVNPRANDKPTAPAMRSSSSHSSSKTPLEIDIDALHKVLFRRHK